MQLNASYVLISNDAERIAKVAQAFATVQPKEVLARLSEWSEISTKQYWMYRRYRFNNVIDPMAAAIGDVRRDAESLVFFTNPAGQPATLRLVSSQPVATEPERIVPRWQPLPGEPPPSPDATPRFPHLLPVSAKTWQAAVLMSGEQVEWESVLTVMTLMGFGIYV